MNILFMGTPYFAVPSLQRLAADGHTIRGVFTQPDKPRDRGQKTGAPPVKECALSLHLPVFQPASMRDIGVLDLVRSLRPDLTVVAAYGKLLPEAVLKVPPLGSINLHSSLLPRYRGAAPIQWAIMNGDTETGVTVMYMAKKLDAGDILLQRRTNIGLKEDAISLTDRLAELGANALSEAVQAIADGTATRTPQNEAEKSYAPPLTRDNSPVDWNRSAHMIHCQIRGLLPWPCAVTDMVNGQPLKLFGATETMERTNAAPGTVTDVGNAGIGMACGDGTILRLTEVQSEGRRRMDAGMWALGHPVWLKR